MTKAMDPYFILPLLMQALRLDASSKPQVGDPMQVRMMKLMPILFTVPCSCFSQRASGFVPEQLTTYYRCPTDVRLSVVEQEQAAKSK